MAIDRLDAFEISNNGVLLEGGTHFSSGPDTPTHTGKAGDWYYRTTDSTQWTLLVDGSAWVQSFSGSALVYPEKALYQGNANTGRYLEIFPTIASNLRGLPYVTQAKITYLIFETTNSSGVVSLGLFEKGDLITPRDTVTLADGVAKQAFTPNTVFQPNEELVLQITAGSRTNPTAYFYNNTGNVV